MANLDKPHVLKSLYVITGAVVFLFATYHGFNAYLDSRIESRITDPAFMQELARNVRPSVVFDENGDVLADLGAMKLIDSIKVSRNTDEVWTITISPSEFLGVEPVLEGVDSQFVIHAERGNKYDWVYQLYRVHPLLVSEIPPEQKILRFRLEIVR
jgi:hypothetical protein